jgi:hypothetical protein
MDYNQKMKKKICLSIFLNENHLKIFNLCRMNSDMNHKCKNLICNPDFSQKKVYIGRKSKKIYIFKHLLVSIPV